MHIVSWNVNGIRAVAKKEGWNDFLKLNPDIFCLQETKASPDQIPEEMRNIPGYSAYFASSEEKKGYSGVATYTKTAPQSVEYGINIKHFDIQGRVLTTHFDHFSLVNVYVPNGGGGEQKFQYKLDFFDAFLEYLEKIRKQQPRLVICGDINIAHEPIDLAHPGPNEDHPCYRAEVREWLDELLRHGYIDTFRHFYPEKREAYTFWDMRTRARDRNAGWRIDLFLTTPPLLPFLEDAFIYPTIHGSDHCPVAIRLKDI